MSKWQDYPQELVRGLLLNWKDVEASEAEFFVIMRCDIELAMKRLSNEKRVVVNTVLLEGEDAITRQAVSTEELADTVSDLVYILNEEGIVPWWERQERERGRLEYHSNQR